MDVTTEKLWSGVYGRLSEKDLQNLIGDGIWIHGDTTGFLCEWSEDSYGISILGPASVLECRNCGVEFNRPRRRGFKNRKYCSIACRRERRGESLVVERLGTVKTCVACGDRFAKSSNRQKYCPTCQNRKQWRKNGYSIARYPSFADA